MKKIRVLSIDGGGIRGIIPGIVLSRLEKKLQQKVGKNNVYLSDFFDFMAGTSTGGILILSYLLKPKNGREKLTAENAVNLYLDRGDEIFDVTFWKKLKSGLGTLDEKYDANELEEALADTFGDAMLSELSKPCIISSYDIRKGEPHFFKQRKSLSDDIYDFKVKDIGRATSAAPTYFEVARIKNKIGTPFPLIDGGVFVNNPALAAYSEIRTMKFEKLGERLPTAKDMMIVSLSTGSMSKQYEYKKAKDWGAVSWIQPVIEIMMSGNSKTVDHHLQQIYKSLIDESNPDDKNAQDYYRLEPKLLTANNDMDNASIENMNKLKEDALTFLSDEDNNIILDEIVDKLIRYE
nr:patatin-like phospholipase family protein [uncultured Carboxylicivirga sp.]